MYELVSPVNPAAVLKYLAQVMMGIGAVMVVPLAVALVFGEVYTALAYGVTACAVTAAGYILNRLLPDYDLAWKEALIIAGLVFPLVALISSFPIAYATGMPLLDAFFEAVSGVTTTGLSLAPADAGPVFLFARSWLQWIGGIGIVLIVLLAMIPPGTSAARLYTANVGDEKIRPGVMATAALLGKVYLVLTLSAVVILLAVGMEPFDAVCHALCAVSTGGFSTRPDSVAAYSGFMVPAAITLACIAGATSFAIYPHLLKKPKMLLQDVQVKYFICIAAAGIVLMIATLHATAPAGGGVSVAVFQVFSALTTAGFSTTDAGLLPGASKAVLIVLMWIGGCVGSTAGGLKIMRIIILIQAIRIIFIRFFVPRETLTPLKVGGNVIEQDELNTTLAFFGLYLMVVVVSAFLFMMHGIGMENAVFEVSSALGTVGLSTGITGAAMPALLKVVLIIDMLLGRVEIIPLCILFFPRTWIKR